MRKKKGTRLATRVSSNTTGSLETVYLGRWLFVLAALLQACHAGITNQEIVTMTEAHAVAGGSARLACDVEPALPGEKLQLVIWYKEGTDTPIYSFDARESGSNPEQGMHWQDPSLGGRASFSRTDKPATLRLETVRESDGGLYRCRVDFRQSPTRNSKVNLTVIIPPEQLSILDEDGTSHIRNYILGPYSEGSSLNITCVASGGRPQPRVTWWQENALLDDSYEPYGLKSVLNVLRLEKLERRHLRAVFTCQASNNNMIAPISSSVSLNMTLKPLWVRILGENRALSAGTAYEVRCEVVGARPPPEIVWNKGSAVLRNARQTTERDGNVTTSVLSFVPGIEDAGKFLTCRAAVVVESWMPAATTPPALEDSWKLNVHHQPVVTLELGSNLNASAIREGMDVYFECNIRSNPWVYKVFWRHNGNPVYNNNNNAAAAASGGTIVSNQSLVLQSVTRQSAGIYECIGSNQEGDGRSNPFKLDVKYAPVCLQGQTRVFGVARQEAVTIPCELEANPPTLAFTWKFNNTMEAVDIAQAHVTSQGTRSTAAYTPMTELDYGTLLCWGSNDQGTQLEPCVFHIVPAGRPDTPLNCTILNQTSDSFRLECNEAFDGGLPQRFTLEVEKTMEEQPEQHQQHQQQQQQQSAASFSSRSLVVHNRTSKEPSFTVRGLTPGSAYRATLYASNAKGRSEPVRIRATTLNLPERRTALTPVMLSLSGPLLGAIVAAAAGLLLVVFVIVLAVRLRYRPGRNRSEDKNSSNDDDGGMSDLTAPVNDKSGGGGGDGGGGGGGSSGSSLVLNSANNVSENFDEKNPDIIPHANENAYTELSLTSSPRYALEQRMTQRLQGSRVESVVAPPPPPSFATGVHNEAGTELTYAELTLRCNRRVPPNCYEPLRISNVQRPQLLAMSSLSGKRRPASAAAAAATAAAATIHHPQRGERSPTPLATPPPPPPPTVYAQVANVPIGKSIYVGPCPPHPYRAHAIDEPALETPLISCDYKIPTITESTSCLSWRPDEPPATPT